VTAGTTLAVAAGLAGGVFAAVHHLGRTWGSTRGERSTRMPGDEIDTRPLGVTNHAVTVDAPPSQVWPWLVQMGYHRGGWYTYPWVDRWIWHIDNPSADRIVDAFQDLRVGDIVPDGEPGTAWYVVRQLDPERSLVLHSTTHLPPAVRNRVWVSWTWSFLLEPLPGNRTRILLRVRATGSPTVMAAFHLLIVPSDLVMARSMLRGIRKRVQGRPVAGPPRRRGRPARLAAHR
jgi:hypothetical protein